MALTSAYVLPVSRIPDLLGKIRDGQAPDRFTHQLLKDWGFNSTNDRAFIPLLKELGFLTAEGPHRCITTTVITHAQRRLWLKRFVMPTEISF